MATVYFSTNEGSHSLPNNAGCEAAQLLAATSASTEFESTLRELKRIIDDWAGLAVVINYHVTTNSWIFIALHDTSLGPATGGCRLHRYATPVDGLRDAVRLAEGMTHKWAILNASRGGGKAVIGIPGQLAESDRLALLHVVGQTIEGLRGAFLTAGDLGITDSDLNTLATVTQYVECFDRATGRQIDTGIYTALGVAAGIDRTLKSAFGDDSLLGRTVLVQGVGHVGGELARILALRGARVLISDSNQGSLSRLRDEIDCEIVTKDRVYETVCDVYAPCALGGAVNQKSVFQLGCRIVAGAANNQLSDPFVADQMHERGILYAPDYVINAGGAIALPMFSEGAREDEVRAKVAGIGDTLAEILTEAGVRCESPLHSAQRRAESVLKKASEGGAANRSRCSVSLRVPFAVVP